MSDTPRANYCAKCLGSRTIGSGFLPDGGYEDGSPCPNCTDADEIACLKADLVAWHNRYYELRRKLFSYKTVHKNDLERAFNLMAQVEMLESNLNDIRVEVERLRAFERHIQTGTGSAA